MIARTKQGRGERKVDEEGGWAGERTEWWRVEREGGGEELREGGMGVRRKGARESRREGGMKGWREGEREGWGRHEGERERGREGGGGEENRISWCKKTAASFKGPFKYLVAKLHGCYQEQFHFRSAKHFSRAFFRSRPVADSSRNKHKKKRSFTFLLINFLLYDYKMWIGPLFLELECFAWKFAYGRKLKATALAARRWGNLEKLTVQDFQCQVGNRNLKDAETNWN